MSEKPSGVAKVFITVDKDGVKNFLFSKKKKKGKQKHGRLELLGGGIDEEESPLDALVRELKEEEKSGILASKVLTERPSYRVVIKIKDTPHYIFKVSITFNEYLDIKHDKKESLGFEIVPESMLYQQNFQSRITRRTKQYLSILVDLTGSLGL